MRLRKAERVSTLAPVVEQPDGVEEGEDNAAEIAVEPADLSVSEETPDQNE